MTADKREKGASTWLGVATSVLLTFLAAASVWTLRIGWADALAGKQTTAATQKAIAIEADNASYPAQLARLLTTEEPQTAADGPEMPDDARVPGDQVSRELRHAVSLNPQDARSWIDLGLRAESKGGYVSAKHHLLRAVDADRGYLPRWTLANYSFRRDDVAAFWLWAKEAIAMIHDDALPFFRLCGRVAEDGNLIDRVQIRNPDVRAAYLYYLLAQERVDLAGPAVQRVLENSRASDVPVLLTACDKLIAAGRVDEASNLWDRMVQRGALSIGEARSSEQILVNGQFTTPPTSRGFDWQMSAAEGISASREEGGQGIRVTFSGNEPEVVEALGQLVPVRGSTTYELQATYRTSGIPPDSGLIWYVGDATGTVLAAGPGLSSEEVAEQRLPFRTHAKCRLIRLSLLYRRAPGTTRLEGYVSVPQAGLRVIDQTPGAGSRVRR